jgi:hypothetical protein
VPHFRAGLSGQGKNSSKTLPASQLRLQNSFIDQIPTHGRGRTGRAGSTRGGRGRGAARLTRGNTNRSLTAVGGSTAPGSQGVDAGQSSRGRGTVRPRSASPHTRWTCRRQANVDAGPSERRPRMMICGDHIYVERTRLNPRILQHPLMALRPVMPLRTIVDQILMKRWKEQ